MLGTVPSRLPPRKRPCATIRLHRAARVLKCFDVPMLKLSAQVFDNRVIRTWITASLAAGEIAGPAIAGRRKVDGLNWHWIPKASCND